MVDLSTKYMGLNLKNPVIPSASPLSRKIDTIKAMEDAGAAAVVLYSLFEEQMRFEADELEHYLEYGTNRFAESLTYFPDLPGYRPGEEDYLEHVRKAKTAVDIPIIASLNGVTPHGWMEYAKEIEQAGADALELNVYYVAAEAKLSGAEVEQIYLDVLKSVKQSVQIPVAMKLSPFFSSMGHMAHKLDDLGANGLVLFNRFYQPDLDIARLEVMPNLTLSTSADLRLPLRWVAILYGRITASMALTSGVHTPGDVIKALMAGGDVAMVTSALLQNGVGRIGDLVNGLAAWMESHDYDSVAQMKGSLSQKAVDDPAAFERANYIKTLHSWSTVE
jgi:dihydroorotate dehydrogenase (fumarate)